MRLIVTALLLLLVISNTKDTANSSQTPPPQASPPQAAAVQVPTTEEQEEPQQPVDRKVNIALQEITPDDANYIAPEVDLEILKEIQEAKKVFVNTNHSQHYGFLVNASIEQVFIFAVDVEQDIEATIVTYWQEGSTYVVSKKLEGEDVRVLVYENNNILVGSWGFYHAAGITFKAKKQHQYVMKIFTHGKNKLLVMDVQHFVYRGSSQHVANKQSLKPFEDTLQGLKEALLSYMTVAETNHIINEMVSENVRLHMHRYMAYEMLEALVIVAFTIAQAYFIRRLLSKGYSIV